MATRLPFWSNRAHEKSSLSLMLVLAEVFCRVTPICSAMDMNLWPKIESSIESRETSAIVLISLVSFVLLSPLPTWMLTLPKLSIVAIQSGSIRIVLVLFKKIVGPSTIIPALRLARS